MVQGRIGPKAVAPALRRDFNAEESSPGAQVAIGACLAPALRAARIEPMQALKSE